MYRPNRIGPWMKTDHEQSWIDLDSAAYLQNYETANLGTIYARCASATVTDVGYLNAKSSLALSQAAGTVAGLGVGISSHRDADKYLVEISGSAFVAADLNSKMIIPFIGKADNTTITVSAAQSNPITKWSSIPHEYSGLARCGRVSWNTVLVMGDEQGSDNPLIAGVLLVNGETGGITWDVSVDMSVCRYKEDTVVFDPTRA